jgi:hypothetical protein
MKPHWHDWVIPVILLLIVGVIVGAIGYWAALAGRGTGRRLHRPRSTKMVNGTQADA